MVCKDIIWGLGRELGGDSHSGKSQFPGKTSSCQKTKWHLRCMESQDNNQNILCCWPIGQRQCEKVQVVFLFCFKEKGGHGEGSAGKMGTQCDRSTGIRGGCMGSLPCPTDPCLGGTGAPWGPWPPNNCSLVAGTGRPAGTTLPAPRLAQGPPLLGNSKQTYRKCE